MSDHNGGLFRPAVRMQPVGCEQTVEELNRHRALSDGWELTMELEVWRAAARKRGLQIPPRKRPR